jgi:hypothetical protein
MGRFDYHTAYFTLAQMQEAEFTTRKIIGHADIAERLISMLMKKQEEIPWFDLTDCERDLMSYCNLKPLFHDGAPK